MLLRVLILISVFSFQLSAFSQTKAVTKTIDAVTGGSLVESLVVPAGAGATLTIGDVSPTEITYLNNVTSAIQTQLDAKLSSASAASTYAPIASPTFTGTVTIPSGASISGYLTAAAAAAAYQPLDADLTIYAGITPSANIQSLLAAANYAAAKTLLSLNAVENTALSTWAGTTNLTTTGTITTGTWSGTTIALANGGTGQTTAQASINALLAASGALSQGDVFYHNGTNVVRLAAGTNGHYLQTQGAGANPQWAAVSSGLTIGSTAITSGTTTRLLFNLGGVVSEDADLTFITDTLTATKLSTTAVNGLALSASSANYGTFVGTTAGAALLSTDTKNSAFGFEALKVASGGGADSANSAFGYRSLVALTTGKSNTGVGDGTLFGATTADGNTAIGVHALLACIDGGQNVAVGNLALDGLTTGSYNTALGYSALGNTVTGSSNIGIGKTTAAALTSGSDNIAVGDRALASVATGSSNIGIGLIALFSTEGSFNIGIGQSAGQSATGNGGIYIGYEAGKNETTAAKLYIDNSSTATPLIYGDFATNALIINGTFTATGIATFSSGTASTSTTTGSAVVTGGLGVSGAAYIGGALQSASANVHLGSTTAGDSGNTTSFQYTSGGANGTVASFWNSTQTAGFTFNCGGTSNPHYLHTTYNSGTSPPLVIGSYANRLTQLYLHASSGVSVNSATDPGSGVFKVTGTLATTGSVTIGTGGSAMGTVKRASATLVGGTVTVSDTATTANSHIAVTVVTPGGTVGWLDFDVSAGSSYTINSTSVLETSTVIITAIHYP